MLPVIETAHMLGYHVITADYLPDNIAHKYSDEYVNVSIVDRDAVLQAAIEKRIDGIMSFGVDPGVISAAFVQSKLGLPSFGPFESVEVLQNKDRFRSFLQRNHFSVPESNSYSSVFDAVQDSDRWTFPVIVKPTDSAGSKGVTKVNSTKELSAAAERAFSYSYLGRIIVERFIEKKGNSSDSDCFLERGVLKYVSFSSQWFDIKAANPYTPAAYTWPSTFTIEQEVFLTHELQRLLSLLHMRTGVYNVETRIGEDDIPYIMEVSPRGGGNRLSEMVKYGTGLDLIKASLRDCVGEEVESIKQKSFDGYWAEVMLHSNKEGRYLDVCINDEYLPFVVEKDIWIRQGDLIHKFNGANDCIGSLVLCFDSKEASEAAISKIDEWLDIKVQ